MQFVSEPTNTVKMQKMKQRVRWQDPLIQERGIDQTELLLDDGMSADPEFSFLVIGDSGSGRHRGHNPQRQIAELMLQYSEDCRFILHTGDVVYLVGSSEYYGSNFIEPYREFIVGGEKPKKIGFDRMVFKQPILPIPGNHDYYDLPVLFGVLSQVSVPIRRLLRSKIDFDVGFRGSSQGDVYARAFLDYLLGLATR
ncbi:MAG TPA: metallophosphoesterase, partial [Allocoleopsis sp.]